jgi:DNA-binding NarL/FixJ family response regulator
MKLALCDDHRLFVDSLARELERHGHQIALRTYDPAQLLDAVRAAAPDVCLLDVRFPQRSGVDVAAELRTIAPATAIVLLTGACTDAVWDAYDRHAVDGVVSKGLPITAVHEALHRVARQERVVLGWSRPAPARRRNPAAGLTGREQEVLALIVEGLATDAMAARLGVTSNTVRTHVQNVLRKLGVNSRGKAATAAVRSRIER